MPEPDYQGYAAAITGAQPTLQTIQAGLTSINNMKQQQATMAAGQAAANGNYAGAAQLLSGSGQIQAGQQAAAYGAGVTGASDLAQRNYSGAAQAAGSVGDAAGVQAAQQGQMQNYQILGSYLKNAQPALQAAYAQAGTVGLTHAVGSITQELTQAGLMSPQAAQTYVAQASSDPQGLLSQVDNFIQQVQYQKVGDNTVLATDAFGRPVGTVTGQTQTSLPTPSGGATLVTTPPAVSGLGANAAPGAAPAAAPAGPAAALPPPADPVAAAIRGNEGGKNVTSVNGAVGPMQMMPGTFQQFAKPGESISNAIDNANVANRAIQSYEQQYPGDPARVMTAYFSGPGNVAPPGSPTPWKTDAKDGNGTSVSQYVSSGLARMQALQPGGSPIGSASASPGGAAVAPGSVVTASTDAPAFRQATPAENAANGGGVGQVQANGKYVQTAGPGDIDNFTPQDIAFNAKLIKLTGAPGPALSGSGGTAARGAGMQDALNKAQAEARKQDIADGVTPGERLNRQTTYKAANSFYQTQFQTLGQMQQYETATNQDFQNVENALNKLGGQTQIKGVNDLLNVARNQLNSVDYNQLKISLKDAQSNFNKIVLGSGTGAGAAPGTAAEREENEDLFPDNATPAVMLGNIAQARLGMNARIGGIQQQLQMAQDTMLAGVPIPHAAIQYLKAHPETAPIFNKHYGAGTASDVLGN